MLVHPGLEVRGSNPGDRPHKVRPTSGADYVAMDLMRHGRGLGETAPPLVTAEPSASGEEVGRVLQDVLGEGGEKRDAHDLLDASDEHLRDALVLF